MSIRTALLWLLVWLSASLYAQYEQDVWNYPTSQYGVVEGLSQNQVICLYVDSLGYLWAGTKVGVNRYNGSSFNCYLTHDSYTNEYIRDIDQGPNGEIWILTTNGLIKREKNIVTRYDSLFLSKGVHPDDLSIDQEGRVYFRTNKSDFSDGLWVMVSDSLQCIIPTNGHSVQLASAGTSRNEDRVYASLLVDRRSYALVQHKNDQIDTIRTSDVSSRARIVETGEGEVFFIESDSLFTINSGEVALSMTLPLERVGNIDIQGTTIAVSNHDSLAVFDGSKWKVIQQRFNLIRDVKFTQDNSIWLATEDGLVQIHYGPFQMFAPEEGMSPSTWSVIEHNGVLFLPTYRYGLFTYTDENGYSQIPVHRGDKEVTEFYMGSQKIRSDSLLFPHTHGTMLYTSSNGFESLSSWGKRATFSYLETENNEIIVCSDSLYIVSQPFTDSSTTQTIVEVGRGFFLDAEQDCNGTIWAATGREIFSINDHQVLTYTESIDPIPGAMSIHKDSQCNLWFGGRGGLHVLRNRRDSLLQFLPNIVRREVLFLQSIQDRYLLVGMNGGVFIVNIVDLSLPEHEIEWEFISKQGGVMRSESQQNGIHITDDEVAYILMSDRLVKFDFSEYEISSAIGGQLIFDSFSYRDADGEDQTIELKRLDTIRMRTNESNMVISFDAIDYNYGDDLEFQFQLSGYDEQSSTLRKSRNIEYTSLPAGKYRLKINVFLQDRFLYGSGIYVHVTGHNIFNGWVWKRFGNGIMLLIPFVLAGTFYYRQKKNRLLEERKSQLAIYALRDKLNSSQINSHVVLNFMNDATAIVSGNDRRRASAIIARLGRLLEPVYQEDNSLLIPLQQEVDFIKGYIELEKIAKPDLFVSSVVVDEDVAMDTLVPRFVIQSFVSNAINHGMTRHQKGGIIRLKIIRDNDFIIARVEDDGIGLKKAKQNGDKKKWGGNGFRLAEEAFGILDARHKVTGSSINYSTLKESKDFPGAVVTIKCYAHYQKI